MTGMTTPDQNPRPQGGLNNPNPEPQGFPNQTTTTTTTTSEQVYAPGQVPTGATPAAPAKVTAGGIGKGLLGRIIGGLITIALIVGGIAIFKALTGTDDPKVGECVIMKGTDKNASHKKTKCDDDKNFTYTVGSIVNGPTATCPENYEEYYTEKNGARVKTFCMMPNFKANKCYGEDSNKLITEVACTDAKALVKVASIENKGGATCSAGEPLSYPEPAPGKTFCMAQPS